MKCTIVDVFAERRFCGNQLAVIEDCAGLGTEEMQGIAREINFSETTFVLHRSRESAEIRIFTPTSELAFAGHPTLGTAWVLGRDSSEFTIELPTETIRVSFGQDNRVWLHAPAHSHEANCDPDVAAEMVGLHTDDLVAGCACPQLTCGPRFVFIPLKSLDALSKISVDENSLSDVGLPDSFAIFAYTSDASERNSDFAARMFFKASTVREDPATGSANCAFGHWLKENGWTDPIVVTQGFEMGRPSHVYVGFQPTVQIGGRVQPVLEGFFVA